MAFAMQLFKEAVFALASMLSSHDIKLRRN